MGGAGGDAVAVAANVARVVRDSSSMRLLSHAERWHDGRRRGGAWDGLPERRERHERRARGREEREGREG